MFEWFTQHRHKLEIVGVQHGKQRSGLPLGPADQVSTIVLMRCLCGVVGTQVLAGDWTLEQIKGLAPPSESVDNFLGSVKP